MKKLVFGFIILFSSIVIVSCKDDSSVNPVVANSSISGQLKFLDNSAAAYARIELKSNASGRFINDTCDIDGNFSFAPLSAGDYTITFRSTSYDIATTYVGISLQENQNVEKEVIIKYNMLDDFSAKTINQDVFFIKMHPDGARIGNNYSLIKNLSGYYTANGIDTLTLSADVYLIDDSLNWNNPGIDLTPYFIRSNFQFLFSVEEEEVTNRRHQINFYNDAIQIMFSNPANGFAFVRRDSMAKEIKIPCVDYSNNDFGLRITYN